MKAGQPVGKVYLVGAGPGSLELVTLKARELIETADVLIYDYLCNAAMLAWARPEAEKIYAGKSGSNHTLTQEEIHSLLIERARAGQRVVRLKGGDPYVFGRGGEEAQVLVQAGIAFEEVPGISSAIAAPAYAGIPVTHREFASTVTFVTGHEDPTKEDSAVDWKHLAGLRGTKVFLMGMERLREIAERLMQEGAVPHTPVALVRWGTTPRQETLAGTLATVADLADGAGFKPPAVAVVGDVVSLRHELNWFESLPLFGQRIVVTRTRAQASELAHQLSSLGADVLEIPTIKIVPLDLREPELVRMQNLSQFYHWLVFTSPNAVELFFESFFKINPDIRALGSIRLAVVGPATRRKLEDLHLRAEIQPDIFTAEELARCFSAEKTKGLRFCLPQGKRAHEQLAQYLKEHGGIVDEWVLYDTVPERTALGNALSRYKKEGAHWITFTSSSTAENWHALQLKPAVDGTDPRVISMGPVTTETLLSLGYTVAAQSPKATLESLVETLCKTQLE